MRISVPARPIKRVSTKPPSPSPIKPPGLGRSQLSAHSLKKKSHACNQAAADSSNRQKPITARGQIRASKASFTMPNQMNPTGSNTPAAPNNKTCKNPRIPPTGPIKFSPFAPDLPANASNIPHRGKSAGLYFTSDSSSNKPPTIHRIPVISLVHRVGSGISPRFLLSLAAMTFALPKSFPDSSPAARSFSDAKNPASLPQSALGRLPGPR